MTAENGEPEARVRLEPNFAREWPGADARSTECVLNLGVLNMQLMTLGEALVQAHGVPSTAAFNVLTILHGAGGPLPPSVIAERMIVSRPTMTGLLRTLERHGLVSRRPHPTDNRMALIEIAPSGREAVEAIRPRLHRAEKQVMSSLTPAERELLLRLIARVQQSAARLDPAALDDQTPDGASGDK